MTPTTPGPLLKDATVAARRTALPLLRLLRPTRYTDADPFKVIDVPTDRITHLQRRWSGPVDLPWLESGWHRRYAGLRRRWHAGIVLDGDWDTAIERWDSYHLARVLTARFVHGREWEDIPYVARALRKVRAGERAWGDRCATEGDVRARCGYLDDLYNDLRRTGYRTATVGETDRFTHFLVNIGRDGRIIRNNDGKHRIVLSHLLGIEHLQARVLLRHTGWQRICDAVRDGDAELAARFRGHPDLVDLLP